MTNALQQIVGGLAAGTIYASLALALVMIYRATGIVNFAQGEMAMLSTYGAWVLMNSGVPIILAILVTIIISVVIGAVVERVIVRRTTGYEELSTVMVTLGLFLAFNGLAAWVFGPSIRSMPSPFPEGTIDLGSLRVSWNTVGTVLTLIAIVLILSGIFLKTRFGLRMRAAASNRESAVLAGINVSWTLTAGWGLAAGVGAVAGILIAPVVFLEPNMMFSVLIYAFAAAALGGFDSPTGAVLGGLIVGLTERLAGSYIPWIGSDLKILVPLVLIFVVLTVRPTGLFGTREITKV